MGAVIWAVGPAAVVEGAARCGLETCGAHPAPPHPPPRPSLWRRLRERPALRGPDAADMGTAFGLEMSLLPDEAAPTPRPHDGSPARRTPWWVRMRGR